MAARGGDAAGAGGEDHAVLGRVELEELAVVTGQRRSLDEVRAALLAGGQGQVPVLGVDDLGRAAARRRRCSALRARSAGRGPSRWRSCRRRTAGVGAGVPPVPEPVPLPLSLRSSSRSGRRCGRSYRCGRRPSAARRRNRSSGPSRCRDPRPGRRRPESACWPCRAAARPGSPAASTPARSWWAVGGRLRWASGSAGGRWAAGVDSGRGLGRLRARRRPGGGWTPAGRSRRRSRTRPPRRGRPRPSCSVGCSSAATVPRATRSTVRASGAASLCSTTSIRFGRWVAATQPAALAPARESTPPATVAARPRPTGAAASCAR